MTSWQCFPTFLSHGSPFYMTKITLNRTKKSLRSCPESAHCFLFSISSTLPPLLASCPFLQHLGYFFSFFFYFFFYIRQDTKLPNLSLCWHKHCPGRKNMLIVPLWRSADRAAETWPNTNHVLVHDALFAALPYARGKPVPSGGLGLMLF